MSKKVDNARLDVLELLDTLGRPLSKKDWLALCEEVRGDIEMREEATRDELKAEENEDA